MNPLLSKIKSQKKDRLKFSKKAGKLLPIGYVNVLNNKTTILAWRLFKSDRRLHLGFVVYRFKKDFGFTDLEIANFTGIPVAEVNAMLNKAMPIIKSGILRQMVKFDYNYDEELHVWRSLRAHGRPQGYYIIKDYPAWYEESTFHKKWEKKPDFQFGSESEKELFNEKTT